MAEGNGYKCVNCGQDAPALYKSYSPTVLKLCKCEKCGCIVDKYVEYDPVIVMIDLVLMSREAQRHVLFNTEFKHYWKLLIVLMILETYGVWHDDGPLSVAMHLLCRDTLNATYAFSNMTLLSSLEVYIPLDWRYKCGDYTKQPPLPVQMAEIDHLIWEKDFYINFICTFCGIAAFVVTSHVCMGIIGKLASRKPVSLVTLLKLVALCKCSLLLSRARVVWSGGGEMTSESISIHYALVSAYSVTLAHHLYTVVYKSGLVWTLTVLLLSCNYPSTLPMHTCVTNEHTCVANEHTCIVNEHRWCLRTMPVRYAGVTGL